MHRSSTEGSTSHQLNELAAALTSIITTPSPNGRVALTVDLDTDGRLSYSVTSEGVTVVDRSNLGVTCEGLDLRSGFQKGFIVETGTKDEVYDLHVGKRLHHEVAYAESTIRFTHESGRALDLVVRSYDDGAAFRYRIPGLPGDHLRIDGEATTFDLGDARCWIQRQDPPGRGTPAYEGAFLNGAPVADLESPTGWTMPALFLTNERWVLLAEAAVDGNYCGSRLTDPDADGFHVAFPQEGEGEGRGDVSPVATTPWTSPWRIVVTASDLATVAQTCLATHLNPPSRIADTSWIRPGRVAWSWWSHPTDPVDATVLRHFVDLAVEMGWEHHLIDAGWHLVDESEIRAVIDDASHRGVGTFLWYNSGGPNNTVEHGPRDCVSDARIRREEFAKIASWGVAGIKIDFFHSDKQERIQAYRDILEDAAEFRLMVNFHGCTAPRGWEREWPNLMTMEAVRGAEQYQATEQFPDEAPGQMTILPFTRNVVGSMDYTPVTFSDSTHPHLTTGGFELALAVVVESGLQHFADTPAAYRQLPAEACNVLSTVPNAWDDTKFLHADPGVACAVARRSGPNWWIGAVNGTNRTLDVPLDLSPLELPGEQSAIIVGDGPDAARDGSTLVATTERTAPKGKLDLRLAPHGGAIVQIRHH